MVQTVIRSLNEFKKKYLPFTYDCERVSKMTIEEFSKWLFHTPNDYARRIMKKVCPIDFETNERRNRWIPSGRN